VLKWDCYESVRVGLLWKCYSGVITEVLQWDCCKNVTVGLGMVSLHIAKSMGVG
jgi:hypothetical protein